MHSSKFVYRQLPSTKTCYSLLLASYNRVACPAVDSVANQVESIVPVRLVKGDTSLRLVQS